MKVIIRADASIHIGSGHVMRCLTIADKLRERGHKVVFFMEPLPGHLIGLVESKGYRVTDQMEEAHMCIIDHYGIDHTWEREIRSVVQKIVVIDDLANRRHDCDVLLDQNVVPNYEHRYDQLVPAHCVKLLGPKYLILRDEFVKARQKLRMRSGDVRRLLIFMGGSDPTGETLKVLEALGQYDPSFARTLDRSFEHVDVVVGEGNPAKETVESICVQRGYGYHCQIDYMASLMAAADFSIGAGGSTTWERCYLGLPSSSTIVASNQLETTKTADELGVTLNIGWHGEVTVKTYTELIRTLAERREQWQQMSMRGMELTGHKDGPHAWLGPVEEA